MTDPDQAREDDVLRRMLATKPKPHSESKKGRRTREDDGDPSRVR
jgi:hypothetical protein